LVVLFQQAHGLVGHTKEPTMLLQDTKGLPMGAKTTGIPANLTNLLVPFFFQKDGFSAVVSLLLSRSPPEAEKRFCFTIATRTVLCWSMDSHK